MSTYEYWIGFFTLFRKELMRVFRIWPQTLLPSVITITLYFLIFGKIIGSKIGNMNGFDYISFISPGLIIMAVINNSYSNVVGSFYGSRFNKSIEELLVSPLPNFLIILGYMCGGLMRSLIVGVMVSIVAFLFGGINFNHHHYILIILSYLLCGTLFSLGGLLNGIFSQKFDDTTIFPTFILTPLIYLGGVFYSLNSLPLFWQHIVKINPLFFIVDFVRYAFLGVSSINPMIELVFILIFIVLLYVGIWVLLNKGIRLKE